MNDLIKQLEPQCWEHNEFGLNFNYEKFAKLIIQEAGEAFWSEACNVSDLAYEEYYRNSMKVKRHFGVEL
jgi:hypothetical protein